MAYDLPKFCTIYETHNTTTIQAVFPTLEPAQFASVEPTDIDTEYAADVTASFESFLSTKCCTFNATYRTALQPAYGKTVYQTVEATNLPADVTA